MDVLAMYPMSNQLDRIIEIAVAGLLIWGIVAAIFGWWQRFVDRHSQSHDDQADPD